MMTIRMSAPLADPAARGYMPPRKECNARGTDMAIAVGDRLPEGTLVKLGPQGPEQVAISALTAGRRVVIFAVPGAYTPTCHSAHVPSFIRTKAGFDAKGVDEIVCISVNDPFVMKAWGEATGATAAGISMLADGTGDFTRAIGMAFDAPAVGLMGRSARYAMLVEDGVVKVLHREESPGTCEVSGGEAMLAAI
jgi:cytochrome c peroxidase